MESKNTPSSELRSAAWLLALNGNSEFCKETSSLAELSSLCSQSASPVEGEAKDSLAPCGRGCHEVAGEGDKTQLRKWAKEERKKLNIETKSIQLVKKIKQTKEYKDAKNIMIYYPLKDEINLLELLNDKTKQFYLPKINGENLLCCSYNQGEELCESCFKTKEPTTKPTRPNILDLIIVPALAVDKNNYRLGYGGGFYDRFLEKLDVFKICCIPKELLIDTIPHEEHDIKLNKVLTA